MRKVADFCAFFFIVAVVILSILSILGVWSVFETDVITKSFQTLGLLAGVSLVVIVASRYMNHHSEEVSPLGDSNVVLRNEPSLEMVKTFSSIRHSTIVLLIGSVVLMTMCGVLSIWEVFSKEVINKSISSIAILGFMSFVIVVTCLEREDHKLIKNKLSDQAVAGIVIAFIFIGWLFLSSVL